MSVRSLLEALEEGGRVAGLARVAVSVGTVLVVWHVVATYVVTNRLVLVPPAQVLGALAREVAEGRIWANAQATIAVLVLSFPVAVTLGVAIGVVLTTSRLLALTAGPILTAMYSVPVVALSPLVVAWLGLGLASKFAVVVLVAVFPVIVTTEVGLRSTDAAYIEAARSFDATPWQLFTTVTFPFALRYIVGGIRVAWSRALVGVVVAEFSGALAGFGFAILGAGQTFDTALLLGYVILLAVMGMTGSLVLEALEKRLAPWTEAA